MRLRINLALGLLYLSAYSNFVLELLSLTALNSIVLMLLDAGLIFLGLRMIQNSGTNLLMLIATLILSVLNYLANTYTLLSLVNGLRELVILILAFSFYETLTKSRLKILFRKQLKVFGKLFLMLQIPICFYQFLMHGAGDQVGGSLGAGNSGILTLVTVILVYILIKEERKLNGIRSYFYALFLIPLFLNETKVSFLLIPIMFLCLIDIRKIGSIVTSLLIGLLIFVALNSLYTNEGRKRDNPFLEMFNREYLESYLLDEVDSGADVPRFTKIILAYNSLKESSVDWLLGKEVGAFKGGTIVEKSDFAQKYHWLLLGSRPYLFYLLISGGVASVIVFLIFVCKKLYFDRRPLYDSGLILLLSGITIIILFYNDAFRNHLFILIYSFSVIYGKGGFSFFRRKQTILPKI